MKKTILRILAILVVMVLQGCSVAAERNVQYVSSTSQQSASTPADSTTVVVTTVMPTLENTTAPLTETTYVVSAAVEESTCDQEVCESFYQEETEYDPPVVAVQEPIRTDDSISVTTEYVTPNQIYPYTKRGQTVGYLSYARVGYSIPIHLGADQEDVNTYDICMHEVNSGYYIFSGDAPLLLLGHNNMCLGGIVYSEVGDIFSIQAAYGGQYNYQVTYVGLVYVGNSVGVMTMYDVNSNEQMLETAISGHAAIQMSTCAAGYSSNYRWLVKADKISGTEVLYE